MGKKGFSLIEVIVVCVIIAIAASIAAPNFANIIKRNQMKGFIQSAQWAEDATMALTGLQYARTASGNPLFVSSDLHVDEGIKGDQYVYVIDDRDYSLGGISLFRVAPANIAAAGPLRKSAGLTDFYKRTMNDLPLQPWRGAGTMDERATCSLYFDLSGSQIEGTPTNLSAKEDNFVKYNFVYSEYYTTESNRQFAIYHGIRFHEAGAEPGVSAGPPHLETADPGWHIYENQGGTLVYYGSL